MKNKFFIIGLRIMMLALMALTGCNKSEKAIPPAAGAKAVKYRCPMHPTFVSDHPGDCGICGMRLAKVSDDGATVTPEIGIPGRIAIQLSPEKRQLIGLTTLLVETQKLTHTIRATATLSHDETTLTRIAPRLGGWVRTLFVNQTGQHVEKGDPLFTVYSPELYSVENNYLIAFRNYHGLTNSPGNQLQSAFQLMETARHRLELMQVGDEEIRALESRNHAGDELLIRAPVGGHVLNKSAVEGKSFSPGESLYEIAPLTRLWVLAYVYEYELPQIKLGQSARVTFPYLNGLNLISSVTFISPHIDAQTRRGEIRLEVDNPGHALKPDMWADVEIDVSLGDELAVPTSAVIDTGTRYVAFVDRADGHLEPREVKLGARTDDYLQVLEGLKSGERVVTRALFLVDSESQLRAAMSGMSSGNETAASTVKH